jgi:hypothetical protein
MSATRINTVIFVLQTFRFYIVCPPNHLDGETFYFTWNWIIKVQSKLLIHKTYASHTNYKYIELILKPYHMN